MTDQSRLSWALALSLLVHLTVLALMPSLRRLDIGVSPSDLVEVDLLRLPPRAPAAPMQPAQAPAPAEAAPPLPALLPERQIVSPSDAGEERPPADTRLLSDLDNTVPRESMRRGDAAAGEPAREQASLPKPVAPSAPQAATKADERLAALPKLDRLLPRAGDLVRQGALPTPAAPTEESRHRNLLRGGGGYALLARPGVRDALPNVREGDITLLNTKAELFAPFVRRVAGRVFQHLQINLEEARRRATLGSGREYAMVEAVMNQKGELLHAHLIERQSDSGLAAHRALLAVTRPDTFFDANPPAGAEGNDGNIHFILVVDLMVHSTADPRTGAPTTGYYGIAGVGLDAPPRAPES
jgi:hypothetical protein